MKKQLLTTAVLVLFVMALAPNLLHAKVSGVCSDCHTMHNSQNNISMSVQWDTATYNTESVDNTPNNSLLKFSQCLGCHKGNYVDNGWPIVLDNSEPSIANDGTFSDGQMTAGGNFYWVSADETTGHNVIPGDPDVALTSPPGYDSNFQTKDSLSRFGGTPANKMVTCAGINGCHGTAVDTNEFGAIAGGHHGDGTVDDGICNGDSVTKSYRFLYGIKGIEDSDWEYTKNSTTDHNQYYGINRDAGDTGEGTVNADTATISYLCCQCHGAFHGSDDDASASPWIRHPTDFDMGDATGSEYKFYNGAAGAGTAAYNVTAPLGNSTPTTYNSGAVTVGSANGTAIVTCLSCHRAHGTPFADILRWQYSDISAASGETNTGCFICHTTKDNP